MMKNTTIFLAGLGATLGISFVVVCYLRTSLLKVLVDICGTEVRADFWTTFSNVLVTVVPTIFALHVHPGEGLGDAWVFALSRQIEWGLIGLTGTVVTMGIVISVFIPRVPRVKPIYAPAAGGTS